MFAQARGNDMSRTEPAASDSSPLLTVSAVASDLGMSEARVRRLIAEGAIVSERVGGRRLVSPSALRSLRAERARRAAEPEASAPTSWDWEGNVVTTLAKHLQVEGWKVVRQANAATRETGVDLEVRKGDRRRLIEVKGWPASKHAEGPQAGKRKRWPATMARNYFGDLLLNAFLHIESAAAAEVAIAVPDRETFTTLLRRVEPTLRRVGVDAYVIHADGDVRYVDGGAAARVYRPADVDRSEIRRTLRLGDAQREAIYVESNRNLLRAFQEGARRRDRPA